MPNEIAHWIGDALVLVGLPFVIRLIMTVSELKTDVKWLIHTMDSMGGNAFRALHSPSDHLGFDGLVEKYESNGYDLPTEDWISVRDRCDEMAKDVNRPIEERIGLGLAAAFANHKLMREGKSRKL